MPTNSDITQIINRNCRFSIGFLLEDLRDFLYLFLSDIIPRVILELGKERWVAHHGLGACLILCNQFSHVFLHMYRADTHPAAGSSFPDGFSSKTHWHTSLTGPGGFAYDFTIVMSSFFRFFSAS